STAATLKAAAAFLEKLRPQGRTDLGKALAELAAQKPSTARMVFLISDGSVSAGCLDPATIVREAVESLGQDTVLYGVQVGATADRTLETLAHRTGGECVTG